MLGVKRDSAWEQYLSFESLPNGLTVYNQRLPEKKTSKTRVHIERNHWNGRRRESIDR